MPRPLGLILGFLSLTATCLQAQLMPLPLATDLPKLRAEAAKENPDALYQLGICYIEEIGVEMDYVVANEYLEKAAAKGHAPAMAMLATNYMGEPGVPRDTKKAHEWAKRALETGHPAGMVAMSWCYQSGVGGERSLDKAVRLLRKAAQADYTPAICNLAQIYLLGEATYQNTEEGLRLAKLASSRDNRYGDLVLGLAYQYGKGVPQDFEKAIEAYKRAIQSRSTSAAAAYAGLLLTNSDPDYPRIIKMINRGVRQHESHCCAIMGHLYLNGLGIEKSTQQAATLLRIAAGTGNTYAYRMLGQMSYQGLGCAVDEPLGYAFVLTSAKLGDAEAQQLLKDTSSMLKQGPTFQKAILISQSISAQIDAAEVPIELGESYHSSQFRPGEAPSAAPSREPKTVVSGSGLVFTGDGYCFTNHHVVTGAARIKVYIPWSKETVEAKLVSSDAANDLAIIKLASWKPAPGSPATPPPVVSAAKAKIGDKVFTVGFPLPNMLGQEPKYTSGDISATTSGLDDDRRHFQITAPIQPGNSGGALTLADGRVVGIIVSTLSPTQTFRNSGSLPQNVNFAVKADYLRILATSSDIDLPAESKPSSDPIEHVKSYCVQVIVER